MRSIKNQFGIQVPLSNITSGVISTDMDFDDYGIYIDTPVTVKFDKAIGAYFFGHKGAGETRLNNNELRDDVLPHLMITI